MRAQLLVLYLRWGLNWLVIPSWFLDKYPGLEEAILGTGNLVNNTTKKETDLQIIGKIANKIKDGASYDDIKALMLKQRYKNVAALPGMFQFYRKFEKSRDGTDLVDETQNFVKINVSESRSLDGPMMEALAMDVRGVEQLP